MKIGALVLAAGEAGWIVGFPDPAECRGIRGLVAVEHKDGVVAFYGTLSVQVL